MNVERGRTWREVLKTGVGEWIGVEVTKDLVEIVRLIDTGDGQVGVVDSMLLSKIHAEALSVMITDAMTGFSMASKSTNEDDATPVYK